MTFKQFKQIENYIDSKIHYYGWVCARSHSKEEEEIYEEFCKREKKISEFRKKVLTEALKKIPDNYF